MKRLIALLLIVFMAVSLTACFGGASTQETAAEPTVDPEDVEREDYATNFDGLKRYFVDLQYVTEYNIDVNGNKKVDMGENGLVDASIIGAVDGKRYLVEGTNFVEFYTFIDEKATPDEAAKDLTSSEIYKTIKNGDVYEVLELSKLEGVVTEDGKYMMLYPADSEYDYKKLEKEFIKFFDYEDKSDADKKESDKK